MNNRVLVSTLFFLFHTFLYSNFVLALTSRAIKPVSYSPKYIPLLQGTSVNIGSVDLEDFIFSSSLKLIMEINSQEPLDSVKLMGRFENNEVKVVGSISQVKGKIGIEISLDNSRLKSIDILVKVGDEHDLRDRVGIFLQHFEIGSSIFSIQVNSEIPSYRIAKSLRNYGNDGVHSFRIPGLVTTPKGTVLAVYDIRRNSSIDLQGDIDVGLSRSLDGGISWEPMKIIMDMGTWGGLPEDQNGIGDPAVLVDHQTGTIWVAALWAHGKPNEMIWNSSDQGMSPSQTGQLMLVKSDDDGKSWSSPINITHQVKNKDWRLFFNGPGKGITMSDGTLVFPAQFKDAYGMPFSTLIYSKDKGNSWYSGTGAKSNTTEAQIVELSDGSLMLNMRDNRGGSRSVAITSDLGKTWSEHASSRGSLIEPVCMASIINHPSQKNILFFSNPDSNQARENITIKASRDEGNSWPKEFQLLLDEGKGWGYSCLTVLNENELGILYESSVANMTYQIIPIADVLKEK